ncbi:hypothetical protein E2C01_010003 [Portunus trituberculatus]|uniref:Uncharacterized protein n=1 Tax=Portunus trituberculatus TaxID=210409 RepID=A0A5B7D7J5_PORTR|nr:hypothetical protein [Portunus trituberculatus]
MPRPSEYVLRKHRLGNPAQVSNCLRDWRGKGSAPELREVCGPEKADRTPPSSAASTCRATVLSLCRDSCSHLSSPTSVPFTPWPECGTV